MTDPIIEELEAVYQFYGVNLITRDQFIARGFVDPQTLVHRKLLRPSCKNGFTRGWTKFKHAHHPCKPKWER